MNAIDRIRRIERLWVNMNAFYGSRWLLEYGPATDQNGQLTSISEIWAKALDEADNSQIAVGIRKCVERDADYPPSLPEFLRLCGAGGMRRGGAYALLPAAIAPKDNGRDTPRAKCDRLAAKLAEEAAIELKDRLSPDMPEESRRAILRGYWLSRMGNNGLGKTVATHLQATIPPLGEAA